MRLLALLSFGPACNKASETGDSQPETTPSDDTGTTTVPFVFGPCDKTSATTTDPMHLVLETDPDPKRKTHLLDVVRDPDSGNLVAVGKGGFYLLDDSGGTLDALLAWDSPPAPIRFDNVAIIGGERYAVSARDWGWAVLHATDDVLVLHEEEQLGYSGIHYQAPYLYLLRHDGQLEVQDLTTLDEPLQVAITAGLSNPIRMDVAGAHGYVADNEQGLVVLDLSDPAAPTVSKSIDLDGSAQDIEVDEGHLYIAEGAGGISVWSLDDPGSPGKIAEIDLHSTVVSVSVGDGIAWAVNIDEAFAFDVADPSNPMPLSSEPTSQFAYHVLSEGTTAAVCDWEQLEIFEVDPAKSAPEIDLSPSTLYVADDNTEIAVTISNFGSAPLSLSGASVDHDGFSVTGTQHEVASGKSTVITLKFEGDAQAVDNTLCISSNDPDEPLLEIPVTANPGMTNALIGEPAPDFTLADLQGKEHTLSDYLGQPVLLVYFASW